MTPTILFFNSPVKLDVVVVLVYSLIDWQLHDLVLCYVQGRLHVKPSHDFKTLSKEGQSIRAYQSSGLVKSSTLYDVSTQLGTVGNLVSIISACESEKEAIFDDKSLFYTMCKRIFSIRT